MVSAIITFVIVFVVLGGFSFSCFYAYFEDTSNFIALTAGIFISVVFIIYIGFLIWLIRLAIMPKQPQKKYTPKTISSIYLISYSAAAFICATAAVILLEASFLTPNLQNHGFVLLLLFGILFSIFTVALLTCIIVLLFDYFRLKQVLKFGKEATATFISYDNKMTVSITSGSGGNRSTTTFIPYRVFFRFGDTMARSNSVFTLKQVNKLQELKKFKIKYIEKKAIIIEDLGLIQPIKTEEQIQHQHDNPEL